MARLDEIESMKSAYAYQCALVANSGLTEQSFKDSQRTAKELFTEIVDAFSPWAAKNAGAMKDQEINSMIDAYKRLIGDPNDPVFQEKLRQTLYDRENKPIEVVQETDEQRINRLLKARTEYYKKKGR